MEELQGRQETGECQIAKDSSANEKPDRRIYDVVIDDKLCGVWEREETHELGRINDCPDNWWVRIDDKWEPWINRGVNVPCFEIRFKQNNRTKFKWNGLRINSTGYLEIYCNLRKVYEFGCSNLNYALAKAQKLTVDMTEHSFNFLDPESEIGRKIWYYNQPAVIKSLVLDQGAIMIEKDGEGGFNMEQAWWTDEDREISDWNGEKVIKDDIFSSNIWWFRS